MAGFKNNYVAQTTAKLTSAGSSVTIGTDLYRGAALSFTDERITFKDNRGRIEFMKASASGGTLTISARGLDQSNSDVEVSALKLDRPRGSTFFVTQLAVQMVDKTQDNEFSGDNTFIGTLDFNGTSTGRIQYPRVTTTERDALSSPQNGEKIYNTTTGTEQRYDGGSRVDVDSGGTFPNASTTAAGKAEAATSSESIAGTDTGGTGALTFVSPSDIAKNIQSGVFLYGGASAAGTDTYAVSLIPALTTLTTGMLISFKTDVANTGACTLNVNSLGAISIKTIGGSDPADGRLPSGAIIHLMYDGTNFVLLDPPEKATQAEVTAVTSDLKYVTPLGLKPDVATPFTRVGNTADGAVAYSHSLGRSPRKITIYAYANGGESIGCYVSGKNYDTRRFGTTPGTDTDRCVYIADGGNSFYGSVTAVSTTEFTITWTKSGTPTLTAHCLAVLE